MSTPLAVLLIEDSAADAELLGLRLERAGFAPAITRVMTAEELGAALARPGWDVVLADYQLPRFSGPEAIALVRESGLDLPIIVVSGVVGEEAAVAAMKAGAHDFVRKDNMARLGPAIERELREARERALRRAAEEGVRQQAERLRLLAEITQRFAEEVTDVHRLLDLVVDRLGQLIGDLCMLRLISDDGSHFETAAIYHPDEATAALTERILRESPQRPDEGLTGQALAAQQPYVATWPTVADLAALIQPEYRPIIEAVGVTSVLIVPMRARGRNLGVLTLARPGGPARAYAEADVQLAQELAERAALALDTARLYAHLEERVVARTEELAATNEELEAQKHELEAAYERLQGLDRLKNNFVNSVSHELRTPLTTIMGYAEFLEDDVAGPLEPEQRAFVTQIQASAARLMRLVDDLLDFARIDAGTFTLRLEPADLCEKAREIVASLRPQLAGANLALELECPDHDVPLVMDAQRIGQVLINLVGNATKFTPPGGRVAIRVVPRAHDVHVEVVDTGIGIDAEILPRLFQRFSQVDTKKGGTGLGLSICKALVEAHGGVIGVESHPGEGSTFWFDLPRSGPPSEVRPDLREHHRPLDPPPHGDQPLPHA